jgi:hypothetical protein
MSSVSSTAASGMSAAVARFQTAASNIANGAAGAGELEQNIAQLITSQIDVEANARVARMVAQLADRLLDITA